MTQTQTKREGKTDFERHALPHMNFIYRMALKLSGNAATAEDLTQETFFLAMQKFHQLHEVEKVRSWLFTILRNQFLGGLEKTRGKHFVDFEDVAFGIADDGIREEREVRDGFSDEVKRPFDRLDEKYKTPLVMSVLEDYSYKEISDVLDIPIGTVMSRIARGKTFLRREIGRAQRAGKDLEPGLDRLALLGE